MKWEEGDIYWGLRNAIVGAKNLRRDPLTDPEILAPFMRLNDIVNHAYFNRNKFEKHDIKELYGWKRVEQVRNAPPNELSVEVWQKGNATVVAVLAVRGPDEATGSSIHDASDKIQEFIGKYPNVVLVGHAKKGSTAVLEAAQKLQNEGRPVPPTLALDPWPWLPSGLSFKKDAPVVGVNLTHDPLWHRFFGGESDGKKNGLPIRVIDGADVAGTGIRVATNLIDAFDARTYYAAFGIAFAKALPDRDFGPILSRVPPQDKWISMWSRRGDPGEIGDVRFNLIEKAKQKKTGSLASPEDSYAGMAQERVISPPVIDPPLLPAREAAVDEKMVAPAVSEPVAAREVATVPEFSTTTQVVAPPVPKAAPAAARSAPVLKEAPRPAIRAARQAVKAQTPPVRAKTKVVGDKPPRAEAASRPSDKPADPWQTWARKVFGMDNHS